jgi:diketogulonate reductase-like aldo/keto reductase
MQWRALGNTGVSLPVIGLGTWQNWGGPAPLRAGIDLGATFIDTAEAYGTEEMVGQAIQGIRDRIFLATKVLPRHFRYSDVLKAANASLLRLNTDYIDLYQLHWPNYTVPLEETLGAMESLVDQGKVRFIGVSNFMIRDLQNAQRAVSKHRIVSNQVRYNLIDRTIEDGLLDYCQQSGIAVIAHSPLATGIRKIRRRDPQDCLGKLASALSRTPAQIALNWCVSKTGVVTIPKASSVPHVTENCQAADFQLSPDQLESLNSRVRFRKRGPMELQLRRLARHALQLAGRNQ